MAAAVANSAPGLLRFRTPLEDSDFRCSTSAPGARFFDDRSSPRWVSFRRLNRFRPAAISSSTDNALVLEKLQLQETDSSFCLRPIVPLTDDRVDRKTLDRWVREAVVEIVKNLRDAPFLHFIYDSNPYPSVKSERRKISRENFVNPDSWSYISNSALDHSPDGMILVQRLDEETSNSLRASAALPATRCPLRDQGGDDLCFRSSTEEVRSKLLDGTTDVWGVLVQGKSLSPSCYILQTTRVAVAGTACTRFCLTRAQCFGPSLQAQLENMWLVPEATNS